MQEIAGLLIYGFLEQLLCNRLCRQITNAPSCDVIFRKRICKPFSNFRGFRNLSGCRWSPGVSVDMVNTVQDLNQL